MGSPFPELTPAWVVDRDVDIREIPHPIFSTRRFRVEETTTTTYADGSQDRRSDFHYENRPSVFWSTRHVDVNVAVAESEGGIRFRFDTDDHRLRLEEPVLIVRHSALGFRPVDVLRVEEGRWLTEIRLPEAGRWPSIVAALATVAAIIAEQDLATIVQAAAVTFAGTHVVSACVRFTRERLLVRSRRTAVRAIPSLRI